MLRLVVLVLACLLAGVPAQAGARARAALGPLDVIALEIGYTTVLARYYKAVEPATLYAGARRGLIAYLKSRGIASPVLAPPPPRADRYAAENAIARDVALAVNRYATRVRTADLIEATITGELEALHDPYSLLFKPAAYKQFVGFLDGRSAAGIGAELDVDPQTHAVRIVDVFPGSPAEAGGLLAGDVITAIDGNSPPTGAPAAVSAALRGAAGSTVRITVSRNGAARDPIALVRRAIVPPDVTGRALEGGIGYVRLRSFGAQSAKQLDAVLTRLRSGGAHAFVLDLRANGGGYRDDAIAVASHFVHGTIVTIQERGAARAVFAANSTTPLLGAPLAVLVDANTASAAEIVAAAVQDTHAGTVIGAKTFGKGLVQETFPLPDGGAIKLTTAQYRTPAGRDIDRVGITPDVVVAQPPDAHPGEAGSDPQLDRALALLAQR
jgi:carboxyl-terminal processing protease